MIWALLIFAGLIAANKLRTPQPGMTAIHKQPSWAGLPNKRIGVAVAAAQPQIEAAKVVQMTAYVPWRPATTITPDIGMAQRYLGPPVNNPGADVLLPVTIPRSLPPVLDGTAQPVVSKSEDDPVLTSQTLEIGDSGGWMQGDVL